MLRSLLFLISIFVLIIALNAQNKFILLEADSLPKNLRYQNEVSDNSGAQIQANGIIMQLMNQGFITASADEIFQKNDTFFIKIYKGSKFTWGKINYKYLPTPMLTQFGFNISTKGTVAIDPLKKSMTQTISYFETKGYPFAYFYWDSLVIKHDTIQGSLFFEKNILITFDTLALYGDNELSKKFLYNYLGFKPGQPFNEATVAKIYDKLIKLPLISVVSKPQIYFVGRKAIIVINIKKRKTDRLDGLIGFAPNSGLPSQTKLLVTGEFHLDFKNLKGSGKSLKADWQNFKARSQLLQVGVGLPYLFNHPIGADLSAGFLKYDTIYTEAKFGVAAQYIFSGLDNFNIFYEQKNTNLLSVDTNAIRQQRKLGELTAMQTQRYGLAYKTITFNNPISPTKGYYAHITSSVFKRNIKQDDQISKVKFYNTNSKSYFTVYDSTQLVSYQLLVQYNLAKAILFKKRFVLFNEITGQHFISPTLYFNELFRFGGHSTFKGFNEQSLFANSFTIINLEIRYLLSEYSFLKVFGNAAYYKDKSNRPNRIESDIPYGFGGGINLETGAGIFNMSVALGKSKFNPIDFKNTKVHFGLINNF